MKEMNIENSSSGALQTQLTKKKQTKHTQNKIKKRSGKRMGKNFMKMSQNKIQQKKNPITKTISVNCVCRKKRKRKESKKKEIIRRKAL